MPRLLLEPQSVAVADCLFTADVISRGPSKIEIEGEYARIYPMWECSDLQKMPASVLMPLSVLPKMVEQLLAVLGHRPVWPEKH